MRERKPTDFGIDFRHCLASFSTSQRESEGNLKGSRSGKDRERTKDRNTGSILVDYQTEELETEYNYLLYKWREKCIRTD